MSAQSQLEHDLAWQIRVAGHEKGLEAEYRFDEGRKWRIDFAWPAIKLAVEVEGEGHRRKWDGKWVPGRHMRSSGFRSDISKYNALAIRGWHLLRFTRDQIRSGEALSWIETAMAIFDNHGTP